jgi:hypothetical protein
MLLILQNGYVQEHGTRDAVVAALQRKASAPSTNESTVPVVPA